MDAPRARLSLVAAFLGSAISGLHAAGKDLPSAVDSELQRAVRSEAAVEQMMRADIDKDGSVTRHEAERLDRKLGERFDAADVDRDGKLTLPEFERLRELNRGATQGAPAGGTGAGGGMSRR